MESDDTREREPERAPADRPGRPPPTRSLGVWLAGHIWPRATAAPWRTQVGATLRRWRRYWRRNADPPA